MLCPATKKSVITAVISSARKIPTLETRCSTPDMSDQVSFNFNDSNDHQNVSFQESLFNGDGFQNIPALFDEKIYPQSILVRDEKSLHVESSIPIEWKSNKCENLLETQTQLETVQEKPPVVVVPQPVVLPTYVTSNRTFLCKQDFF